MPVLQNTRFILVELIEVRQELRVARPDLAYRVIKQPAAHCGALLDEVQIIRAEQHRVYHFRQLRRGFSHTVDRYLFCRAGLHDYSYRLVAVMTRDLGKYLRRGIPESGQLAVKPRAEAAAAGEHIHGF